MLVVMVLITMFVVVLFVSVLMVMILVLTIDGRRAVRMVVEVIVNLNIVIT